MFPLGPRATAVLVFAVLAVAAAALARRMWPELVDFVRREWRLLLSLEAVFLAVFVAWALMRAGMPGILHTEQPMDFAFLNASMIAPTFPPEDPWLSGHGISYYYFGFLTMGLPGVLAGIPSGFVYNLALALLPAMAAMGVVSLVTSVAVRMGAALYSAFGVGLLGALMLGLPGQPGGRVRDAPRVGRRRRGVLAGRRDRRPRGPGCERVLLPGRPLVVVALDAGH